MRVRDTGISAVSTVHSELFALQRQPPVDLEHTPIDDQLRGDHNQLRNDFDTDTTSVRTDMVALSTDVNSKLQMADAAIAHRLDASDQRSSALTDRISLIEQQLPQVRATLDELRVARLRTGQLGSPTSDTTAWQA